MEPEPEKDVITAKPEPIQAPEPPAMGERRARWGYGYQDKVATAQVLDLLRVEIRDGTRHFEGVRLAIFRRDVSMTSYWCSIRPFKATLSSGAVPPHR
jgi:hypothetical protein